ncbi:hypothetical protein BDW66DRAFT_134345 [Aspergillus desertorum]
MPLEIRSTSSRPLSYNYILSGSCMSFHFPTHSNGQRATILDTATTLMTGTSWKLSSV